MYSQTLTGGSQATRDYLTGTVSGDPSSNYDSILLVYTRMLATQLDHMASLVSKSSRHIVAITTFSNSACYTLAIIVSFAYSFHFPFHCFIPYSSKSCQVECTVLGFRKLLHCEILQALQHFATKGFSSLILSCASSYCFPKCTSCFLLHT